jgi:hypothetical protein
MSCSWTVGVLTGGAGCVIEHALNSATNSVVSSATQSMSTDFTDSFTSMLNAFANTFTDIPGLDFTGSGLSQMYGISLGIAAVVAVLMLFFQTVRTVISHSGEPLARALAGFFKAVLACVLVLSVGDCLQNATDELSRWIVHIGFNPNGAAPSDGTQFAKVMNQAIGSDLASVSAGGNYAAFMIIVGIVGCAVVGVLWIEMVMRNAGLAVLAATAPIAAFGQMGEEAASWWRKLVRAGLQLMILKPMIAFIFVLGLAVGGEDNGGITQVITGLMILAIAVIAWPALGRFMTFTESQAASSGGVGAMLGFAAGRASTAAGGGPAGSDATANAAFGGAGTGSGGAAARAARAATGAATGGTATAVAAVARAAAAASQSVSAHMSQMGGHAGLGQGERIGGGPHYLRYNQRGGATSGGQSAPMPEQQPGESQPAAPLTLEGGEDPFAMTQRLPVPPADPLAETQANPLLPEPDPLSRTQRIPLPPERPTGGSPGGEP